MYTLDISKSAAAENSVNPYFSYIYNDSNLK